MEALKECNMSHVIRYETELDWFDLSAYLSLESKPPSWWRRELVIRQARLSWGMDCESYIKGEKPDLKGLSNDRSKELAAKSVIDGFTGNVHQHSIRFLPIDRLLLGDYRRLHYKVEHKGLDQLREQEVTKDECNSRSTISVFNEHGISYLKADLHHSDSALIDAFKAHLKEARAQSKIEPTSPTKVTKRKLEKLAEYKALAILDLWIWEKENGVKIKKSVLASKVFKGNKGERELDDSIYPFIQNALRPSFLEGLTLLENS
jgi:hypothetical protein